MIAIISRLTDQKGLDLVQYALDRIIDDFTQFVYQGRGDEKEHLRPRNQMTELEDMQEFIDLEARGMTLNQIAAETGRKRSTIHRKLKKAKEMGMVPTTTSSSDSTASPSHPTEEMGSVGRVGNEDDKLFKDGEE